MLQTRRVVSDEMLAMLYLGRKLASTIGAVLTVMEMPLRTRLSGASGQIAELIYFAALCWLNISVIISFGDGRFQL